ncbi:MAG: CAAX prenyl protease-related protein [Geobacteraceae bacterium]|nr:CAAX prenyl protease-related protein [Geobacteraceae bacterium]
MPRAITNPFLLFHRFLSGDAVCRTAPFALYMAFIALEEVLQFLSGKGVTAVSEQVRLFLYPVKAGSVALLLFLLRKQYTEIVSRDFIRPATAFAALGVGLGVFALWISMDFPAATMGTLRGYDPYLCREEGIRIFLTVSRLAGAALVVPFMEELFWRSFLIRYIIAHDFTTVPLGRFTWPSFLITAVLFGLEHNLFLAGITAGIIYNLFLYLSRSLAACILAHGVTNLALGLYVLHTGKWHFW